MARPRKKHMKLPNGFGSIKKLSGNRRRPFAAYPSAIGFSPNGSPILPPAIGYYESWYEAYDALAEYRKNPYDFSDRSLTFSDVYTAFTDEIFSPNAKKKLSASTKGAYQAAYKNSSALHTMKFFDIRASHMQACIDNCPLKHASLELILNLYKQMYKFARKNGIVEKDYSEFVSINIPDDDEKGEPFTETELRILWENKDNPTIKIILIMIYSGFRVSAYRTMRINLDEKYFQGGVKTKAGKNRIVPIHPAIYSFVEELYDTGIISSSTTTFRADFKSTLKSMNILNTQDGKVHTPHDCRHTFSWLCDNANVDELSKRMMLGHTLGNDVTNLKYGHRTLEQLRHELEKIVV